MYRPLSTSGGATMPALVAAALIVLGAGRVPAAAAQTTAPPPYEGHVKCTEQDGKKDCKIDLWLTRGLRAFSQCQVCHGLDGNGSSFAPSLVEKLKTTDQGRFVTIVANGYKGQIGVMPPWRDNPNVMNWLEQLYAYLKARSDGVIPGGILERYDR